MVHILFELISGEGGETVENPVTVVETITDIIQFVMQFLDDTVNNVVNVFKQVPVLIETLEFYFELIPPSMFVFMSAIMGFAIYKFQLAYLKGSGQ